MMEYKLQHESTDHQEVLREILHNWSKSDHDIYIISDEGHRIFTQKNLLSFYSHNLGSVLDSLPPASSPPGISVPTSSTSITNLLKLLTTGQVASNYRNSLVDLKEAAKALGISLENCTLQGQVTIRKLSVNSEPEKPTKVSPSNLTVFKTSTKWNTFVISAKNEITEIPENCGFDEENSITNEFDKIGNEFACSSCPKVFNAKKNLKRHKLSKHGNGDEETTSIVQVESLYECSECDRKFQFDYKLKKHSLQHSDRFTCDQCKKGFQSSSTLRNHMNIHLDVKPFKCDICEKEFSQAGNLKTHMHSKHNDAMGFDIVNPNSTATSDAFQ